MKELQMLKEFLELKISEANKNYQNAYSLFESESTSIWIGRMRAYEITLDEVDKLLKLAHESNHAGCCPFCKHGDGGSSPDTGVETLTSTLTAGNRQGETAGDGQNSGQLKDGE